jgi:hypothetical protein
VGGAQFTDDNIPVSLYKYFPHDPKNSLPVIEIDRKRERPRIYTMREEGGGRKREMNMISYPSIAGGKVCD